MDMAGKTGAADGYLDDVAKIRQMKKDKEKEGGKSADTKPATTTTKQPTKKKSSSSEESSSFSVHIDSDDE